MARLRWPRWTTQNIAPVTPPKGKVSREEPIERFKITLYNCNTHKKMVIMMTPESLDDSYSAQFSEKPILGRSSPIVVYTGGSSRKLDFSITVHEDLLDGYTDIRQWVDDLKAMSLPVYNNGVHPPKIYCRVGSVYAFWGVMNTTVTYKRPIRDNHYIVADVKFEFTRIGAIDYSDSAVDESPLSATYVEKNGYDRSGKQ